MRKQDRAQRWRWGLLFALAGLAWLLLGGNDGEEFEFEDEDDAPQRLLASHVAAALGTPRYCRSDLPGCVPQQMEYILFLHIPEVGRLGGRAGGQGSPGVGALCGSSCAVR